MRRFSSRQFNQDVGAAKKAALEGPVIITDRGKPTHVLLSVDAYSGPLSEPQSLREVFSSLRATDGEFDVPVVLKNKPQLIELD